MDLLTNILIFAFNNLTPYGKLHLYKLLHQFSLAWYQSVMSQKHKYMNHRIPQLNKIPALFEYSHSFVIGFDQLNASVKGTHGYLLLLQRNGEDP